MTAPLQDVNWFMVVVDVALVALLLYQLFRLLRETTAVRILVGLPVVLVVYLLAQVSGLITFTWLLDNFLGSLLLVLVIVFQYDIRRAVLSSSRARLQGRSDQSETGSVIIDQLAQSAGALAERRHGALIVIEREISLEHFMEVGTDIDARVTSELLASIFLPYSPIHDGAVIIQRGKLTKAGCFLPLTQNPEVAKQLGTRHRAAIGLTELTDAVVLVVSEESGAVSVVVGGKITPDLEPVALKKMLRRLIDPRWLQ
jgi:uncharacterized protein (TIGR00159 family)